MKMMDKINEFVDTMITEKKQFENLESEVSEREQNTFQVLKTLEKNELQINESLKKSILERNDKSMEDIFSQTSQSLLDTITEANKKIEDAVKGMKFIHDFEKQFTISVFGKVKAGKSYIGNFVMGQSLRKLGIASSYDKLENLKVQVYDKGKLYEQGKLSTLDEQKEINGEEFYVDKNEATSTIQWVNIGGMCWLDTPGIGSVTIENEILAKEYIKNSDLVIFACNSDAAGTRQEFTEISQLYAMGKPMLLLLTQSDTYDYDIDENGEEISVLVPKSDKDRNDQEQYMRETLREQGMEDVLKYADILTISALLATKAIENMDETMFEQSNMGILLEKLTEITKNDAADMKRNTPKSRINEMIDSIVKDLQIVNAKILDVCAAINDSKRNLTERKDWMVERIKATINLKVQKIVAEAKVQAENGEIVQGEDLQEQIGVAIGEIVKEVCVEEAINNTSQIPDLNIELTGIGDMKMRQDSISYEYTSVHQVPRPPRGLFETLGEIILKKQYYKSEMQTEIRQSTFDIGVNDVEIANNIRMQLNDVSTVVDSYIKNLTEGYYEPVEILECEIDREITEAIGKLQKMRM